MPESTNTTTEELGVDIKQSSEFAEHVKVRIVKDSDALAKAIASEKVNLTHPDVLKLFFYCGIMLFVSSGHGYDSSLMSSILALKPFRDEFATGLAGTKTGLITAMYQIGGVCSLPFMGPLTDYGGRRYTTFIALLVILLGTILEGTSQLHHNLHQFMAGRFFLGFGVYLTACSAPTYVVEVSHPKYRGLMAGMYNVGYYAGAILAAGLVRGCKHYDTNTAWLVPTWFQALFPLVCGTSVLFFPESPRWLFTHGHKEKALAMVTKYHGEGNPDSEFVKLQMEEFENVLVMEGTDKQWWNYSALMRSRQEFYRVFCGTFFAVAVQWCGGGIGYFIAKFYTIAGVSDTNVILDLNIGGYATQAVFGILGAKFCDKFGRRPQILTGFIAVTICWVAIISGSAVYAKDPANKSAALVGIVFYWFFSCFFAYCFSPLQALYPVECLSYEQRAKGMAFCQFAQAAAGLVNQFGTSVGLERIGWKIYIVWLVWTMFSLTVNYFLIVETRGFTLEELDEIFSQKNPVKASLKKRRVILDEENHVLDVQEVSGPTKKSRKWGF